MRDKIIQVGVKRLRESYPDVTAESILTDQIYSAFFKASLMETIDDAGEDSSIGRACKALIAEMENQQPANPTKRRRAT